ncbi:MAG: UDP-N-acetylglucosamine 2-epimerase [bacterium]|nr:UDP-N-acetylglucosamine 2-epimerase [bacterium]
MNKRIAILTSSRADFGIYLPLLNRLKVDKNFDLKLIVFGTHLSLENGYTVDEIIKEGFNPDYKIFVKQNRNDVFGIADNYADYTKLFAEFWELNGKNFDLVFALGDRYEMAAAVMAGIPFGIKFAHLHAGETTLGAIDNTYRHCITLASSICFTSTEIYKERVAQLVENTVPIYNVGALSLDDLEALELPSKETLANQFNLDFSKPLIMVVFHPETIHPEKNKRYIHELLKAIENLSEYSFAINLPNTDTNSDDIRTAILEFKASQTNNKSIAVVEHFGKRNYFACLKYASLLIGNSSSGIIEAASFNKYVLNIGDRQKGRAKGENIVDCEADSIKIVSFSRELLSFDLFKGQNIYKNNVSSSELIQKTI